jgi:hypothetical protein
MDKLNHDIKVMILAEMPDMASLDALVHSCPEFHKCYLLMQKRILFNILTRELTMPVFIQALAVIEAQNIQIPLVSKEMPFNHPARFFNVHAFMDEYAKRQSEGTVEYSEISLETLIRVAEFYKSVRAITSDYLETCLGEHPLTLERVTLRGLSKVERLRIHRAIYNLELYFTLFKSANPAANPAVRWGGSGSEQHAQDLELFSIVYRFSVAEVEEMSCMEEYMYNKNVSVFREIRHNQHLIKKLHRRELRVLIPKPLESDTHDPSSRYSLILVSLGIELFASIHKHSDLAGKLSVLKPDLINKISMVPFIGIFGNTLRGSIKRINTNNNNNGACAARFDHYCPTYEMRIDPSSENPTALPNSYGSWKIMKWFSLRRSGHHWHFELWQFRLGLLGWGYAMWDAARLEEMGLDDIDYEMMPSMGRGRNGLRENWV